MRNPYPITELSPWDCICAIAFTIIMGTITIYAVYSIYEFVMKVLR